MRRGASGKMACYTLICLQDGTVVKVDLPRLIRSEGRDTAALRCVPQKLDFRVFLRFYDGLRRVPALLLLTSCWVVSNAAEPVVSVEKQRTDKAISHRPLTFNKDIARV